MNNECKTEIPWVGVAESLRDKKNILHVERIRETASRETKGRRKIDRPLHKS